MLRLLCGGYDNDKTNEMFLYIEKSIDEGKDILVIVPDQFSFEYDKQLYKYLGAKKFNSLEIKSFERLSEGILRLYGTTKGEYADDNTKQLIMHLAIKKMKKDKCAVFYTRQLEKPEFISNVLDIVKDFRHAQIDPSDISGSQSVLSGALSDKISDLSYLYSTYYDILSEKGFKDSLSVIGEAAAASSQNNFFEGKTVFIDKFNSFSPDEMSVAESIIKDALEVTVSLTQGYGNNSKTALTPFANVIKTEYALCEKAKECSHEIKRIRVSDNSERSVSLSHICDNIFNPVKVRCDDIDGIKVTACNDMYEESEYVSAQIKHLVAEQGYRYKDIAIVSRQLSDYTSVLPPVLDRYDIPYFMDTNKPVSQKALILYVMSIIKACSTNKPDTENILMLMKSTLSGYSEVEVSRLEDYCFQWNVQGEMWLSDFVGKTSDQSDKYLSDINEIRKKVIEPIRAFKEKCDEKTASQMCRALYELFETLNLPAIMSGIISAQESGVTDEQTAVETAREFKQLWGLLTCAVRCVYNVLGNEKITFHEFYDILSQLLFNSTISTPPQKLDAVIVASADRSMLSDIKIVFIMGVNEGIMPKHYKENGLFTEKDKETLEKLGYKISRRVLWKLAEERFTTYRALSCATKAMYITYPLSDTGGQARRPSPVIRQLTDMFGNEIINYAWDMPKSFYCCTMHSSYYKYCEGMAEKTSEMNSIKEVLKTDRGYAKRLEYLDEAKQRREHAISMKTSSDMFFENDLNISATKVESYFKCPFAFFCSDGLKIRPNRAVAIDPLSKGTIVHYCLEKLMSKKENDRQVFNEEFLKADEDKIRVKATEILNIYKNNELGGDFGKTKRFEALLCMLISLVVDVAVNIRNELNNNNTFMPHEFEYNLSTSKAHSIFEVELDDSTRIVLRGKIDRVDMFENDGKQYVRVIDYKTNAKEFDLADVYHGINMQMILYLMAITDNSKTAVPVGVLYMPAVIKDVKTARKFGKNTTEEDRVTAEKSKLFIRNGLVIRQDDEKVMEAMKEPQYIKIKNKTLPDGLSSIIPFDSFIELQDFAKQKLVEMATKLKDGKIPTEPIKQQDKCACDYCDYWSICGEKGLVEPVSVEKADEIRLKCQIGIIKEGEEDEDVDE